MTRVKVYDGKYEFIVGKGTIEILRYGEKWIENFEGAGSNAVLALILELADARSGGDSDDYEGGDLEVGSELEWWK